MKKIKTLLIGIIITTILSVNMVYSQQMIIHLKTGKNVKYKINSIEKITYQNEERNSNKIILSENFEDNLLDYRINIESRGNFISKYGIKSCSDFGSSRAFGFGKSSCGANCFENYQTSFIIKFDSYIYVNSLSFKVKEKYGNWGGKGFVYIDNAKYEGIQLSKIPSNDGRAETSYRKINIPLNKKVKEIKIRVYDITSSSEIFIDDILIK